MRFHGVAGTRRHGGEGDRTPDLVNAIHALSQLSYAPQIDSAEAANQEPRMLSASMECVKKNGLAKSRIDGIFQHLAPCGSRCA